MSQYPKHFLRSPEIRARACQLVASLPVDQDKPLVIEIKELTRTLAQNALFWAVMTDIAEQVNWHGRKLSKEDWKHVLSAALYQQDVVPNIDGNGFVVLGKSTSKMTVREMRDLIELAQSFGAQQGVKFGDESRRGFDWVAAYGRAAA
ncbi:recombination protein NinB [Aeromonas caviae]|uniref:recombination protein NinB n=1 Tax=Aeromonas TaxID=642 RepID=UPI0015E02C55|nr:MULTISPECIES: recombination protein NinB [Aeromonas]MBL0496571.1 recombination protein NinB [Aeromonas caviae]MDX7753370.1 recombination protein NinB [Aeromonas caviae]MDX7774120.1 recombination protein NinB [Aeromonas caviae]QLL88276.1 recombination protein NinB [Aeromonas caviae]